MNHSSKPVYSCWFGPWNTQNLIASLTENVAQMLSVWDQSNRSYKAGVPTHGNQKDVKGFFWIESRMVPEGLYKNGYN